MSLMRGILWLGKDALSGGQSKLIVSPRSSYLVSGGLGRGSNTGVTGCEPDSTENDKTLGWLVDGKRLRPTPLSVVADRQKVGLEPIDALQGLSAC